MLTFHDWQGWATLVLFLLTAALVVYAFTRPRGSTESRIQRRRRLRNNRDDDTKGKL